MYLNPGGAVVTSLGAYPTFNFHVAGFGGRLVTVPYANDREDLDALLEAARREKAALVYLSNPDNPMGTWWEAGDITRFIAALPETTMLVLDEAYGETAPRSAIPPLDLDRPNVIRTRTFSKAYGLAGLRCGYAIGEAETIGAFDKVRNHFGVNKMAQVAAQAALADQAYLRSVVERVAAGRERIAAIARDNGLAPIASATNFVTIDCGADGAFALKVLQALIARDVFVRKPMAPGLDRCIRVSVGLDPEMAIFEEELPGALATARGSWTRRSYGSRPQRRASPRSPATSRASISAPGRETRRERLGLDGWVRNEHDGSVTALIAGPRQSVDAMIALLHRGPPDAVVAQVTRRGGRSGASAEGVQRHALTCVSTSPSRGFPATPTAPAPNSGRSDPCQNCGGAPRRPA